jgi:hypothetical protein
VQRSQNMHQRHDHKIAEKEKGFLCTFSSWAKCFMPQIDKEQKGSVCN